MTVKELKNILSKYDENLEVLIDDSVDGGWSDVRDMEEWDIQKYDNTRIIFNYKT